MTGKKQPAGQEPKGYAEAIAELEGLLRDLDSGSVDVDVLSTKVSRASYLIDWCSERITAAQMTIDEMVAGFDDGEEEFVDEEDDELEDDDDDEDEDEDE